MCTLATILQFTVSHRIVLFPYLYPQHFGCKMCIDQPTSWLSSCTAKTSHLALNQRRLSSCQDSSFHTEMFASAECIWFMFQINHLPKKHAFYRRQISKKGFFFFMFMVAQVSAMLISLRQHAVQPWGDVPSMTLPLLSSTLRGNWATLQTVWTLLFLCVSAQQAFIPSDIPPPHVESPATKGVGKEIHFVCVRVCVCTPQRVCVP